MYWSATQTLLFAVQLKLPQQDILPLFFSAGQEVGNIFLSSFLQGRHEVNGIRDQRPIKGRDQDSRPRIWNHSAWDRDQQCSQEIRDLDLPQVDLMNFRVEWDQDVLDNNKNIKMHFYSDSRLDWHFEIFKAVYFTRTTLHLMMNTQYWPITQSLITFQKFLSHSRCHLKYHLELTFRISLVRTGCTRESPEPVVHLRRFSEGKKKDDRSLRRLSWLTAFLLVTCCDMFGQM